MKQNAHIVEAAKPRVGYSLGRRGVRQAEQARHKWIAYYSPLWQAMARKRLKAALEAPKEVAGTPEAAEQELNIKLLRDASTFTPYVRTEPKIRHKRGSIRRIAKHLAALEDGTHIPVDYIPPPVPETVPGAILGPAQ